MASAETAAEQLARWRRMMLSSAYTEDDVLYGDEYRHDFWQYLADGTVTDVLRRGETNGGYVVPAWSDDGAH